MNFTEKSKDTGREQHAQSKDWRFKFWRFNGHPTIRAKELAKKALIYKLTLLILAESAFGVAPVISNPTNTSFNPPSVSTPAAKQDSNPESNEVKTSTETMINSQSLAPNTTAEVLAGPLQSAATAQDIQNIPNASSETFKSTEVQSVIEVNKDNNRGRTMGTVKFVEEKAPVERTPVRGLVLDAYVKKWLDSHKSELEIYNKLVEQSRSIGDIKFSYELCVKTLANIKAVEFTNPSIMENSVYKDCIGYTDNQIAELQKRHLERVAKGVSETESALIRDQAILSNLILKFGVAALVAAGSNVPSKIDKANEMLTAVKKGESINLYSYLGGFLSSKYYIHPTGTEKTLESQYHKSMVSLTPEQIKAINWEACSFSRDERGCIAIQPDLQDLLFEGTQFRAPNLRAVYLTKYTQSNISRIKSNLGKEGLIIPDDAPLPYNARIQARDYNPKFLDWNAQKKAWVKNERGVRYGAIQDLIGSRTGALILNYGNSPEAFPLIFQLDRYSSRNLYKATKIELSMDNALKIMNDEPRQFDVTEWSMKACKDRAQLEMKNLEAAIKKKDVNALPLPDEIKKIIKEKNIQIQPLSKAQYYELYTQLFGHLLLNWSLNVGERLSPLRDPNFVFSEILHDVNSDDKKKRGVGVKPGMFYQNVEEIANLGKVYLPAILGTSEFVGEVTASIPDDEYNLKPAYSEEDPNKLIGYTLMGSYDVNGDVVSEAHVAWHLLPKEKASRLKYAEGKMQKNELIVAVPETPAQLIETKLFLGEKPNTEGKPTTTPFIFSTKAITRVEDNEKKKLAQILSNADNLNKSGLTDKEVAELLIVNKAGKIAVSQESITKLSKILDSNSMRILSENLQTTVTKQGKYTLIATWRTQTGEEYTTSASVDIAQATGYIDAQWVPQEYLPGEFSEVNYDVNTLNLRGVVKATAYTLTPGGKPIEVPLPMTKDGKKADIKFNVLMTNDVPIFGDNTKTETEARGGVVTEQMYNKCKDSKLFTPYELKIYYAAMGVTPAELKLLKNAKDQNGNPLYTREKEDNEMKIIETTLRLNTDQLNRAEQNKLLSQESIDRLRNLKPLSNGLTDEDINTLATAQTAGPVKTQLFSNEELINMNNARYLDPEQPDQLVRAKSALSQERYDYLLKGVTLEQVEATRKLWNSYYARFDNTCELTPLLDKDGNIVKGIFVYERTFMPVGNIQTYGMKISAIDNASQDKKIEADRLDKHNQVFVSRHQGETDVAITQADANYTLGQKILNSESRGVPVTVLDFNSSFTPGTANQWLGREGSISKDVPQAEKEKLMTDAATKLTNISNSSKAILNQVGDLNNLLRFEQGSAPLNEAVPEYILRQKAYTHGLVVEFMGTVRTDTIYDYLNKPEYSETQNPTAHAVLQTLYDYKTKPAGQGPTAEEAMAALMDPSNPFSSQLGGTATQMLTSDIKAESVYNPFLVSIQIPWPGAFIFKDARIAEIKKEGKIYWHEFEYTHENLANTIQFGGDARKELTKIYEANKLTKSEIQALKAIGAFKLNSDAKTTGILDTVDYDHYQNIMKLPENQKKVPADVQKSLERFGKEVSVSKDIIAGIEKSEMATRGFFKTFKAVMIGKTNVQTTFTIDGVKQEPISWEYNKFGIELDLGVADFEIIGARAVDTLVWKPHKVKDLFPVQAWAQNLKAGLDIWGDLPQKRGLWKGLGHMIMHDIIQKGTTQTLTTIATGSNISATRIKNQWSVMVDVPLLQAWSYWPFGKSLPVHAALNEGFENVAATIENGKFVGQDWRDLNTGRFSTSLTVALYTKYGKPAVTYTQGDDKSIKLSFATKAIEASVTQSIEHPETGKAFNFIFKPAAWNWLWKTSIGIFGHKKDESKKQVPKGDVNK